MCSRRASIRERNRDCDPRLVAHGPRRMALAGQVFGEDAFAGAESVYRAVAEADLDRALQRNHELAARRVMPVHEGARLDAAEDDAVGLLHRRLFAHPARRKRDLEFFEVRLPVGSRVQTMDSHRYGLSVSRYWGAIARSFRVGKRSARCLSAGFISKRYVVVFPR